MANNEVDRRLRDVHKQLGKDQKEPSGSNHLIHSTDGKVMTGLVLVRPNVYWQPPEKPAFLFAHPNPTSEHMIKHGIFEQPLITWARQYLTPNSIFIDIGAHAGTYALSLAPFCREVHAFEAQRITYYQLCGGVALNQYRNVLPHHCALGASAGVAKLHITSTDGGGSTLDAQVPAKQNQSVLQQEECEVRTLDSFQLGGPEAKIGLIKIDVEGHELAVLQGAKETLKRSGYPPILFEAWTDAWYVSQKQALFVFLSKELGYKITAAPNSNNMFLAQR